MAPLTLRRPLGSGNQAASRILTVTERVAFALGVGVATAEQIVGGRQHAGRRAAVVIGAYREAGQPERAARYALPILEALEGAYRTGGLNLPALVQDTEADAAEDVAQARVMACLRDPVALREYITAKRREITVGLQVLKAAESQLEAVER